MEVMIYTLRNSKGIKYIGKTNDIDRRLYEHILNSKKLKTHKDYWVRESLLNNDPIIIELLEVCDESNWEFLESYWISQFKTWGFSLCNLTEGGDGVKIWTDEMKFKLSENKKNLFKSDEVYKKNLLDRLNVLNKTPKSEELKNKISKKLKGRKLSYEHKEKLKIPGKNKGRILSEETKNKISSSKKNKPSPNKGKKMSDEQKNKLSLAKIGKKRNENFKKIISECKKMIWKIKSPNNEIINFNGFNEFKEYIKTNNVSISLSSFKSYGKSKNWILIEKIKQ